MSAGVGEIVHAKRWLVVESFQQRFSSYLTSPLDCGEPNLEHRLLLYPAYALLVGATTFFSFQILGLWRSYPVSQAFQGMYVWHTTLNFGLCFVVLAESWRRLWPRSGLPDKFNVSSLWFIGLLSFFLAFMLQRTVVYAGVEAYSPEVIRFYRSFPAARPGFWPMLLWCLLFWLPIFSCLVHLALWQQRKRPLSRGETQAHRETRWTPDGGKTVLTITDITRLCMEDHYARVFWRDDGHSKQTLARLTMKQAVKQLPSEQFLQIHRSHLINLDSVRGLVREGRGWVVLVGEDQIPVSRNRVSLIKQVLKDRT